VSLRARFVWFFSVFSLLLCALFSGVNFLVAFTLEDRFFERLLADEGHYLVTGYQTDGRWPTPRQEKFSLHLTRDSLPADIGLVLGEEPGRSEFFGRQGRHYHLRQLSVDGAMLVAEVSGDLLVRPRTRVMLLGLGLLTLVMMLLGCALAYYFARRALEPLARLKAQVAVADPNSIPQGFATAYPHNEIGVLAAALDAALGRVRAFVEREVQFTRDASHELRTPITVVAGAAELLQASADLPGKDRALVARIATANTDMAQTVEALLTLARSESAIQEIGPVALLPLVEKTVLQQGHLLDNKAVDVVVTIPPTASISLPRGVGAILLTNLIANAFQYTLEGEVCICFDNGRLTVADTGQGIAPELQEDLTQPLVKGENSQGFGIGLSIVQRFCDSYGLTLTIENVAAGCRVTIDFPPAGKLTENIGYSG
jgi:signal transduction histidine kinase